VSLLTQNELLLMNLEGPYQFRLSHAIDNHTNTLLNFGVRIFRCHC